MPNTEDTLDKCGLDSGDPRKAMEIEDNQESLFTAFEPCNASSAKEMTPYIDDKKSENKNSWEQLESSIITTNGLSVTNENTEKAAFRRKHFTKHSDSIEDNPDSLEHSKNSTGGKEKKIRKRVHFKSEVETLTYEPILSLWENYNYTEEFSLENVFAEMLNERRTLPGVINGAPWKSEINLATCPRPCNRCSIMEEWVRCEHGFRRLRREHIPVRHYTRLNDEDGGDASKKERKIRPILKKSTSSYTIPTKKNQSENGHPSGNLRRRLSMSMHNLRIGMKSMTDKLMPSRKKENIHNPLWVHDGIITDAPMEELISLSRSETTDSPLGSKKEDENESPSAMPGNVRRWKSMYTLNRNKSDDTLCFLESPEFNAENNSNDAEKSFSRTKRRFSLFGKNKCEVKKSSSAVYVKPELRDWMSIQNLNINSQPQMEKILKQEVKK